ncbi:MAG: ferredoxin [Nitrospirae bacterium GWC2_57_9]|nr:MAG: ferredoxin [Nitrospirae bacterium GWC2_57_9]
MSKKHKVIFQPSGRRGEVEEGQTLLQAAQSLGVDIEALCGNKKVCGKCKVRIEEGYFEKDNIESGMTHIFPPVPSPDEMKHIKPQDGPGIRLACQCEVRGDVKVFVPERSRAGKQVVRKAAKELTIKLDPAVKKYNVELKPPTLHEMTTGDWERVLKFLEDDYGLKGLTFDYLVLRDLQDILRKESWKATVTVWMDKEIVKVEPGFVEASYGLAVDIGTTTCVGYLTDLNTGKVVNTESMMNPQVPYGEDVMSRITYAMSNPGVGLETMQKAIIQGLNEIIERVVKDIAKDGPNPGYVIDDLTIVFNTAMHHIFLGLNPEYIGRSPFIPAVQSSLDIKARDLGLRMNPSGYIHVLPIEAGFVGADNVGVLIAEEPYNQDENVLIIDIGTNGELLLGNRKKVCSTSCATGPAFEGAQIKFGMRAAPGAIEKVEIDPETKEARYKVIGRTDWSVPHQQMQTKGLCGSGIIQIVAEMFKAGIIDKSGRFVMDLGTPRVRKDADGKPEYVLAWASETSIQQDVTVTQGDVRALQLAKGALYTGAKLMMKKLGMTTLDRVILAGAFGSHIDVEASLTLGLFPDCTLDKVYAVGNAAGDGSRMALLNRGKRREANERARWVEFVEIATDPAFEKEFMMAMHIPHMKDRFPNLKALLEKANSKVEIKA